MKDKYDIKQLFIYVETREGKGEFTCQISAVGSSCSRLTLGAGNLTQVSHAGGRKQLPEPSLLLPRDFFSRKLEYQIQIL